MLNESFSFLGSSISKVVSFIFSVKINENPSISLGSFILSCFFIGFLFRFIFGTDFFPTITDIRSLQQGNSRKQQKNNNSNNKGE